MNNLLKKLLLIPILTLVSFSTFFIKPPAAQAKKTKECREIYISAYAEEYDKVCYYTNSNSCIHKDGIIHIEARLVQNDSDTEWHYYSGNIRILRDKKGKEEELYSTTVTDGYLEADIDLSHRNYDDLDPVTLVIDQSARHAFCKPKVYFRDSCDTDINNCSERAKMEAIASPAFKLCDQINNAAQKIKCKKCADDGGIWTAVGCIPTESDSIIQVFIKIGLGAAGGIALLIILAASFMLATSQGDPKKVGDARDMITSAIIGLIFIIFSITILQFIGVQIFHIPGFGE